MTRRSAASCAARRASSTDTPGPPPPPRPPAARTSRAVHVALTGVSNRRTLDNFARAGARHAERPELPLVIASTLLVPGYIDADQVSKIAGFIASINAEIPYSLLGFGPSFYMSDLACTSVRQAAEAEAAARAAGLANVRVGNRHLLGLGTE